MLTLASLFDGISGFPIAGSRRGITPIWASEIEPFPIRVSGYRFPDMTQLGDITGINGTVVEPVDIVTFGSPCQDLSVAGKQSGMKHQELGHAETTRSGLFMEAVRIIKEMREATAGVFPRYAVWENVPGAFSSNKGDDFHAVIEELIKITDETVSIPRPADGGGKWTTAGAIMGETYSLAWRTVDAQYFGVAQRRRRIYLVLDLAGGSAPEILFKPGGLCGDPAPGGSAGQGSAADAERSPRKAIGGGLTYCLQGNGIDRADTAGCNGKGWREDVCYTLNTVDRPDVCAGFKPGQGKDAHGIGYAEETAPSLASSAGGNTTPAVVYSKGTRPHSADEAQKWYESETANYLNTFDIGEARASELIVSPTVVCLNDQGGSMISADANAKTAPTLRAEMHGNIPAVIALDNHPSDSRVTLSQGGTVQTLTSRMGTGGGNVPMVMAHGQANAEITEDACPTLNCNHEQPIVCLDKFAYNCGENGQGMMNVNTDGITPTITSDAHPPAVGYDMIVRRLTPLECERLQGYPDGWTDIPPEKPTWGTREFWRGVFLAWDRLTKHGEVKGRSDTMIIKWLSSPANDTARYKALGNSVAIPCVEFVLGRIALQVRKERRIPDGTNEKQRRIKNEPERF